MIKNKKRKLSDFERMLIRDKKHYDLCGFHSHEFYKDKTMQVFFNAINRMNIERFLKLR